MDFASSVCGTSEGSQGRRVGVNMWPIKTKQEIHDAFMLEIGELDIEIRKLDHEIERSERKKARIQERISQLKVTAKLFE